MPFYEKLINLCDVLGSLINIRNMMEYKQDAEQMDRTIYKIISLAGDEFKPEYEVERKDPYGRVVCSAIDEQGKRYELCYDDYTGCCIVPVEKTK